MSKSLTLLRVVIVLYGLTNYNWLTVSNLVRGTYLVGLLYDHSDGGLLLSWEVRLLLLSWEAGLPWEPSLVCWELFIGFLDWSLNVFLLDPPSLIHFELIRVLD